MQALYSFITVMLSFIVFIFVHEISHALGFVCAGKVSWKDIEYGVKWDAPVGLIVKDHPEKLGCVVVIGSLE